VEGVALIKHFILEEIKEAVQYSDNVKCLGPNGIKLFFIKDFWD